MKIAINKLVGDLGEQWAIEVPVSSDILKSKDPVNAIKSVTEHALRVVDDRLLELNMRLINHNRAAQALTPEGLLAVHQCMEIMYGRRTPADGPIQGQPKDPDNGTQARVENAGKALETALEGVDQGR